MSSDCRTDPGATRCLIDFLIDKASTETKILDRRQTAGSISERALDGIDTRIGESIVVF
jgi:hypothetical protein